MPHRTVAARRTDSQPLFRGSARRAPDGALLPVRWVRPAAPRASARRRCPLRAASALGRWRCRWSTPLHRRVAIRHLAAGIGRRESRFLRSLGAWSCARCWAVPAARAGASRQVTTVWRRGRTRSTGICSADPAAWPNAALAAPAIRPGTRLAEPELIDPDSHAELDGVGARAERYRGELAGGRWALPAGPSSTPHPPPQEDASP